MTEYYKVKIPLTENYSIVSFIQTPNSGAGIVASTISSDFLADDPHTKALEELIGELITTAIGALDKTPRDETTYSGERKFARFYRIGNNTKLVGFDGRVESELVND